MKGVVKAIVHDAGRGAPLAEIHFRDNYKFATKKQYFLCAEGMYSGQYIFCGAKANLATGNVLPVKMIPEGTLICNVEERPGDTVSRLSLFFYNEPLLNDVRVEWQEPVESQLLLLDMLKMDQELSSNFHQDQGRPFQEIAEP